MIYQILMTEPHTSKNEEIPNGQLMHLALEVARKAIETQQNSDINRDAIHNIKDASLPPICAL